MSDLAGLVLLTRPDCDLCEEFLAEFAAHLPATTAPPLRRLPVDSDATLVRRYGLKIPVLLLDGELVCWGRFDPAELDRLLGAPARRRERL
ncbi:MAG: glutaredoxin family protein [Steroidobacteraceae bacterium]